MRKFYIKKNIFSNGEESSRISNILSSNEKLLDEIDENVRMWFLERNNKSLWAAAIDEGKVLNPKEKSSIDSEIDLKHLVIVTQVDAESSEIFYGNANDDLSDFVKAVLENVKSIYPKH